MKKYLLIILFLLPFVSFASESSSFNIDTSAFLYEHKKIVPSTAQLVLDHATQRYLGNDIGVNYIHSYSVSVPVNVIKLPICSATGLHNIYEIEVWRQNPVTGNQSYLTSTESVKIATFTQNGNLALCSNTDFDNMQASPVVFSGHAMFEPNISYHIILKPFSVGTDFWALGTNSLDVYWNASADPIGLDYNAWSVAHFSSNTYEYDLNHGYDVNGNNGQYFNFLGGSFWPDFTLSSEGVNVPIDGQCSLIGVACSSGDFANQALNSNPDGSQYWSWNCNGLYGGQNLYCTFPYYTPTPTSTATSTVIIPPSSPFSGVNTLSSYFPSMDPVTSTGLDAISQWIGNFVNMIGNWIFGTFKLFADTIISILKYLLIPSGRVSFSDIQYANIIPIAWFSYLGNIQAQDISSEYALQMPDLEGNFHPVSYSWNTIVENQNMANALRNFTTAIIILAIVGGLVALIKLT